MTRGRGQRAWGMEQRVEEEEQNNVEHRTSNVERPMQNEEGAARIHCVKTIGVTFNDFFCIHSEIYVNSKPTQKLMVF
jgi:hypothetical protein